MTAAVHGPRVTQADRDIAAEPWEFAGFTQRAKDTRDGKWDDDPEVQALARHREASQAELVEALEACVSTLEHTRAFMLQKHGTTNPAREEALEKARAALTKARTDATGEGA